MTVFQVDTAKANANAFAPAPKAQAVIAPPVTKKVAPVVEEEVDEPVNEPVKVSKPVAAEPAPKADMANLIDEWDA